MRVGVSLRFGDGYTGEEEGCLTAHPGTSLRDWAAEVERRVRREMAVAVYFIVAGICWASRDEGRERGTKRLDWCCLV